MRLVPGDDIQDVIFRQCDAYKESKHDFGSAAMVRNCAKMSLVIKSFSFFIFPKLLGGLATTYDFNSCTVFKFSTNKWWARFRSKTPEFFFLKKNLQFGS